MEIHDRSIYDKNTLEFATVALEFCSWIEQTAAHDRFRFVDKATKLLPLLYLKATLLPEVEENEADEADEFEPADHFITEETYEAARSRIGDLLGEYDQFLDTFSPDMPYSDTPIAASIAEQLADTYQDIGNFIALFRQGHEPTMQQALAQCTANFRNYWGQRLLNALKALHAVRYDADIDLNAE